jgi:hypothetical protein
MRPVLLIEAAAIGIVTAYGFLSLWHDWKMSHGPQTVVFQFHISPKNLPGDAWRTFSVATFLKLWLGPAMLNPSGT